jgi:hypothetical protein
MELFLEASMFRQAARLVASVALKRHRSSLSLLQSFLAQLSALKHLGQLDPYYPGRPTLTSFAICQ